MQWHTPTSHPTPPPQFLVVVFSSVYLFFVELQLKPYHFPCKLFKRWSELLGQFTTASYEDIEAGVLCVVCVCVGGGCDGRRKVWSGRI